MSLPQSEDQLRQLAVDELGRLLLQAAENMRRDGWWRPGGYDPREPKMGCIMTHLGRVLQDEPSITVRIAARNRIAAHLGYSDYTTIDKWNDAPGRTKDEVIAALTAAAFRTGE